MAAAEPTGWTPRAAETLREIEALETNIVESLELASKTAAVMSGLMVEQRTLEAHVAEYMDKLVAIKRSFDTLVTRYEEEQTVRLAHAGSSYGAAKDAALAAKAVHVVGSQVAALRDDTLRFMAEQGIELPSAATTTATASTMPTTDTTETASTATPMVQ
eukprot:m.33906 g.33906  ORF g.33906 m.33906 type:complete len:160 (-) comp11072_c0_seq2:282-761(-)